MNLTEAEALETLLASVDPASLDPAATAAADQLAAAARTALVRRHTVTRSPHARAVLAQLPTDECVPWPGKLDRQGYGRVTSRVEILAHRLLWRLVVGAIPLPELDHLCRNRSCVNPAHLEPVTAAENGKRRLDARTGCRNGHTYTPENTYWCRGFRQCRDCRREYDRKRGFGARRTTKSQRESTLGGAR